MEIPMVSWLKSPYSLWISHGFPMDFPTFPGWFLQLLQLQARARRSATELRPSWPWRGLFSQRKMVISPENHEDIHETWISKLYLHCLYTLYIYICVYIYMYIFIYMYMLCLHSIQLHSSSCAALVRGLPGPAACHQDSACAVAGQNLGAVNRSCPPIYRHFSWGKHGKVRFWTTIIVGFPGFPLVFLRETKMWLNFADWWTERRWNQEFRRWNSRFSPNFWGWSVLRDPFLTAKDTSERWRRN